MALAAVYIRQTEAGPPAEQQRAECVLAIETKGWTPAAEFLDIESFVGKPGRAYGDLLSAMRAKLIERVVAYSAERMFRGVHGMTQVLEHARVGGVSLYLCREGLSTEGNHGAYLVRACKLMAEVDVARRAEMTSLNHVRHRTMGKPWGRPRQGGPELQRIIDDLLNDGMPVCAVARQLNLSRGYVRLRAADRATNPQE